MPTMYYGKGQTNPPSGQDTTNYSVGARYRSDVLRLCAEKCVKFVDLGPAPCNWNNTALGTPFGDSIAMTISIRHRLLVISLQEHLQVRYSVFM